MTQVVQTRNKAPKYFSHPSIRANLRSPSERRVWAKKVAAENAAVMNVGFHAERFGDGTPPLPPRLLAAAMVKKV